MVSYYLNRLENLIEKWQSRRKTIEISSNKENITQIQSSINNNYNSNEKLHSTSNLNPNPKTTTNNQITQSNSNGEKKVIAAEAMQIEALPLPEQVSHHNQLINLKPPKLVNGGIQTEAGSIPLPPPPPPPPTIMMTTKHQPPLISAPTQTMPKQMSGLICMLSVFIFLVGLLHCYSTTAATPLLLANAVELHESTSRNIPPPTAQAQAQAQKETRASSSSRQFTQLGFDLIQQLSSVVASSANNNNNNNNNNNSGNNRNRWIQIPGPNYSIRDPSNRRQGYFSRILGRLRNQIGARNTIRVHNAFRDFAWRLLSSLSMPTPVIYELRRQNLYSPEDDLMNDSLFNKNTTRTIRSKRQLLNFWPNELLERRSIHSDDYGNLRQQQQQQEQELKLPAQPEPRRASDEEDDDDSLRGRVRWRFEDLFSPRRRRLFGGIIRVPILFPFKRQEDESDDSKGNDQSVAGGRSSWLRRRRKEVDRQMITINGKQYYVNDEGELKELNDKSDQ